MSVELVLSRSIAGKLPPSCDEAEEAVLSACIVDPRLIGRVRSILQPDHFASGRHQAIWKAILAVVDAGASVDVVSVGRHLRDEGRLAQVGSMASLTALINSPYTSLPNTLDHARFVFDAWRMRRAIHRCQLATAVGYTDFGEVQPFLDSLREDIQRIADASHKPPAERNLDVLKRLIRNVRAQAADDDGVTGIPTGFRPLDRRTAGLHSGHLTIVGARPGVGKTSFLGQIALHVASKRIGVGFVSLEMTRDELLQRALCTLAGVNTMRMRTGQLSQTEWSNVTEAAHHLSAWPIYIDDQPNRNIRQVRESVYGFVDRAAKDKVPLGVVVLDYLQFVSPTPEKERAPLREGLAQVSKGLKDLSRELGLPIVVAVALNRDVDKAGSVRFPRKSDIRDCGNIESDADNIVFIHRRARVVDEKETFVDDGEAWFILDKQRGGVAGEPIKVRFEGQYSRFVEAYP